MSEDQGFLKFAARINGVSIERQREITEYWKIQRRNNQLEGENQRDFYWNNIMKNVPNPENPYDDR